MMQWSPPLSPQHVFPPSLLPLLPPPSPSLQAEQLRKISEMHEEMMANQKRQQVRGVRE